MDQDERDCIYGVEELAERGGVSRRTVRYYIQRGLLPPPAGLGRGKHYGEQHLSALVRIRELQEAAVPLDAIAARLEAPPRSQPRPESPPEAHAQQTSWTRVLLAPDLELHVRGRRLSEEQVRRVIQAVNRAMGGTT